MFRFTLITLLLIGAFIFAAVIPNPVEEWEKRVRENND